MPSTMTSDEIREAFLSFFEGKEHMRYASSSLIPTGDPTLLLTSAGMVQFKSYFTGEAAPPSRRLTTSQKCFRTTDIDEVGDAFHNTFFEMLGNFSVGDYFKKEAVAWALEFVTQALGLPQERFSMTVHDSDDEAHQLWVDVGIPPERISRFGDKDNWWGPAGLEGPCGPCSELHYDLGQELGCGRPDCGPNCPHCNRFVELWNLVFMQYYHHLDGTRTPLPAPNVDTGLGLERAAVIMQQTQSIYETDIFTTIMAKVSELSGKVYGQDEDTDYALRVVAEHGRSAAFLIADGVVPGNEGRGYVLRRIIRRAIRHGGRLGLEGAFLGQISQVVIEQMGELYPELRQHQAFLLKVLELEEEGFSATYERGSLILFDMIKQRLDKHEGMVSGEETFLLHDTYGFPPEVSAEIAREHGLEVDMEGFQREMEAQRERARAGAKFAGERVKVRVYEGLGVGATQFLGYETLSSESVAVGLIVKGSSDQSEGWEAVGQATEGQEVEVVLRETPFYAEGGGQVGDAGRIVGPNGVVEIMDTQNGLPDMIVHIGTVTQGAISLGDAVEAKVDAVRREDCARNHTATHLLHAALRQVLGPHVRQAGSLVAPDRLRFDFSHVAPMTREETLMVQRLVNEKIREDVKVHKRETTYAAAIREGALAFFGDKYGENVRVVEVANGVTFSYEVCGGTHVAQTGEVGACYILDESSIGSGMRRIEATTGRGAESLVSERLALLDRLSQELQASVAELESRAEGLLRELDQERKRSEAAERRLSMQAASELLDTVMEVDGVRLLAARAPVSTNEALRDMGDWLRDKLGSGIILLGAVINERPSLMAMVTQDLVSKGFDAVAIVQGAAKAIEGGGGGRPQLAQAGGRRLDKLDDALRLAPDLVRKEKS